jgi:hypothetical protein
MHATNNESFTTLIQQLGDRSPEGRHYCGRNAWSQGELRRQGNLLRHCVKSLVAPRIARPTKLLAGKTINGMSPPDL